MRFITVYKPADLQSLESGAPPTGAEIEAMGAFIGELAAEGVLVQTDGLLPTSTGARVIQADGKVTVIDGPFTEAKELIAGYAIIDVPSKAEAVAIARRFLAVAGDGESEVRQMYDVPAFER